MEFDSFRWKHATSKQALQIGIDAGVHRTILTHFSGRYTKIAQISPLMEEARGVIAFDHTRISWS